MFRRLLPALLLSVLPLANGCYDSHFGQAGEAPGEGSPNASLADIRARFTGQPVVVEGDIRVAGRVTTSDRAGNFYRTLCIEDAGAALEVMVGLDHLHNDYPPGSLLLVRLRGLTLGEQFGVLQAGSPAEPGSGYATGFLGSKAAADAAVVRLGGGVPPEAAVTTIPELAPSMCGTLVRIPDVELFGEEAPVAWAGYHRFADTQGNLIRTYVRTYADFAGASIPEGRGSLTGILQQDGTVADRYILKLRDETDFLLAE